MDYDTAIECTYKLLDIVTPLEKELLKEDEEEYIRMVLYQSELLRVFRMEHFDEDIMVAHILALYALYKDQPLLQQWIQSVKDNINLKNDAKITTNADAFVMLFSYETFDIMHQCICDLQTTNEIGKETVEKIRKKMEKMK